MSTVGSKLRTNLRCFTWRSNSRSKRSFTVQPAPRKMIEATPNNASVVKSGRLPFGAASAIDLIC